MAELDGSSNVVSRFIYADKAHVPAFMVRAGITYRVVSDHLGSVRLVVNSATGAIAQRLDYDSYGNVVLDTNPGFQPFGFAGGIYDGHTELVRFGARDYDSSVGRWLSSDPLGLYDGTNTYAYVHNNPINFNDPFGLATQFEVSISGTLIGGAGGGGGTTIGISVPDKLTNWRCYQGFLKGQANAMLGLGGFAGVGVSVGTSSSDGPLQSGISSDSGLYAEHALGWGLAGGVSYTAPGNFLDTSTWMNNVESISSTISPKLGAGFGLLLGGFGQYWSSGYTTPTGNGCDCN